MRFGGEWPILPGVIITRVSERRRAATVIGIVLAVAVAIGTVIFLRMQGDDSSSGAAPTLSGRWMVTRIDADSAEPIVVPSRQGAEFSWTPAGPQRVIGPDGEWQQRNVPPSLDASDGVSTYGCFYDRDGDQVMLRNCVVTPNVPVNPTDLQQAVGAAFEQAFRNKTMKVTSTPEGGLAVTLGGTVFTLTKAD